MSKDDLADMSAAALVRAALAAEPESDEQWPFVMELHRRDDASTFTLLVGLLEHEDPLQRELGANALGQFAYPTAPQATTRPFAASIVERLISIASTETDPAVIQAIATALGHRDDERGVPSLVKWRSHADDTVRWAVAFALGSFATDVAIQTLLELTTDEEVKVRDWATFGLGVLNDADSEPIRQALLARLDDTDPVVRGEAFAGLARRKEVRAVPALREAIDHIKDYIDYQPIFDAAIALAPATRDPHLVAYLRREHDEWLAMIDDEPIPEELRAALAICDGEEPPPAR